MRQNIKEIGDAGLRFTRNLNDGQVRALLAETGLELAPGDLSASLSLDLMLMGDTVFVTGQMSGSLRVACSRCLAPAEVRMDEPAVQLSFFPRTAVPGADKAEVELDPGDLDTYGHNGEHLELGELLREHLMLAIPMSPLCRQDCAGLEPAQDSEQAAEEGLSGWQKQLKGLKDRMEN